MSEKRITKRDNFNEIRDILEKIGREDLVAFVDNELNLLAKKAAKTTLTKTQKENIAILDDIFNALSNCNKPVTAAELIVSDDRLAELKTQKIAALLKKLVDAGQVIKVTEKGKSYYSIAD